MFRSLLFMSLVLVAFVSPWHDDGPALTWEASAHETPGDYLGPVELLAILSEGFEWVDAIEVHREPQTVPAHRSVVVELHHVAATIALRDHRDPHDPFDVAAAERWHGRPLA